VRATLAEKVDFDQKVSINQNCGQIQKKLKIPQEHKIELCESSASHS